MWGRKVQQRIYLAGLWGEKPPVPVHPEALAEAARRRMSLEAWAYVAGGAGLERTMAENRQAFDRYRLLPRMLRGAPPPALGLRVWERPGRPPVPGPHRGPGAGPPLGGAGRGTGRRPEGNPLRPLASNPEPTP
ncbi:MAG: alpha-hydroxy-acid oxidizing protein [Thermus sp.]